MKKIVNNKIVNIDNIELFELAEEGLASNACVQSNTEKGLEANIRIPLVHSYITQYNNFVKMLPYPLYAIERDIKYATIGNFIKSIHKNPIIMWVDRGLHIKLDTNTDMTISFVGTTWGIEYIAEGYNDNTSMENFRDCVGYKEYLWVLRKVLNREGTTAFYKEFMPEFLKACNNQVTVLKWELENMLTFSAIPNKVDLEPNKVRDLLGNKDYMLDIFDTGYTETDEEPVITFRMVNGSPDVGERRKRMKTYDFTAYSKSLDDTSALTEEKIPGLYNLFLELCSLKYIEDNKKFSEFNGIMNNGDFVFTINSKLYISTQNRIRDPELIAHGVELYAFEGRKVYFTKVLKRIGEPKKQVLYSYSLKDKSVRVCKIVYIREE